MDFPDNSFDVVWACESGEHMPDKAAYINEMMRVLKPAGNSLWLLGVNVMIEKSLLTNATCVI